MSTLWQSVLPVIQDINDYGGNFISIFVSQAVLDEIDRLADGGDKAMESARKDLKRKSSSLKGPANHAGFNGFFESYQEALFCILAQRRGVQLRPIPETTFRTPDFETREPPPEAFELKTIDFSGGVPTYKSVMEAGLDQRIETSEKARQSGIGISFQEISPHGKGADMRDAVTKVMEKIHGNVKHGQYTSHATYLVVPVVRTAIRTGAAELQAERVEADLGGKVSGHLWTIAAHRAGAAFFDATQDDDAHNIGAIHRAGILRDFPFIAGIAFIGSAWNTRRNASQPFQDYAFHVHGVWNDAYEPPDGVSRVRKNASSFVKLCDAVVSMK